jgi:DNA-binding NtrC family response regulator
MATVLIVEDEESLRDTLTRYVGREGHEVLSAADGREAFDVGVSACPDVLITDWMLKNHIHGLHVSEALKAVNPTLHTILITGFPSRDLLAESDRCGVLQLLEKPFDLQALHDALTHALDSEVQIGRRSSIAVVETERDGSIRFVSDRARQLCSQTPAGSNPEQLHDLFTRESLGRIEAAGSEWTSVQPVGAPGLRWLVRSRGRANGGGLLLVLCSEEEQARVSDPRVRILLDHRSRSKPLLPDNGPVVVIERDGVVRRLLVSQIERIGALCYPADDIEAALKLLSAEPRARTVLLDFGLAQGEVREWTRRIKQTCPDVLLIGTGGVGSEEDLLALGVARILPKPWRIMDLLDAMTQ